MTKGEYSAYNIEELYEMTQLDDPDAMDDLALGWSNVAELFQSKHSNLSSALETIEGKWTAKSSEPYREEIRKTLKLAEMAWKSAERSSESMSNMATQVRVSKQNIADKYQEWLDAKGAASAQYETDLQQYHEDPIEYIKQHPDRWNQPPEKPDDNAVRQQYDEAGRTEMNTGLEFHQRYARDVARPETMLASYEPLEYNGSGGLGFGSGSGPASDGSTYPQYQPPISPDTSAEPQHHGGPDLQTGPATPSPTTPAPSSPPVGPSPVQPNPGAFPPVTPPVSRIPNPTTPNPSRAPQLPGRSTGTAPRTPSLPNSRGLPQGRSPGTNPGGNLPGRGGQNPGGRGGRQGPGGRGLQQSRTAPTNRVGRVRASGEVMGRRGGQTPKSAVPQSKSPIQRRVQPPVLRGARGAKATEQDNGKPRADRTRRGYTKSVLGERKSARFSRTPRVAGKVHDAGKVFGKRTGPISPAEERRQRLDARQARREKLRAAEAAAPAIGAGVLFARDLDEKETTGGKPVEATEEFWHNGQKVTPGVIGARRPRPEPHHDPGPGVISTGEPEPEPEHDPGITAFGNRDVRKPHWP